MINGVIHGEYPVVYDPPKPQKIIPNEYDLVTFDKFGMGSIIGQITNKGASAYALLPLLKEKYGEDSKEYQITLSRLKQTCKAQSAQIDKTKIGREVKGIPKCWYEKDFYGTEEEMREKNEINNHILLNQRPYFFKYLYEDSKKDYNEYLETQDYRCKKTLGKPLQEIMNSAVTQEEKDFLEDFYSHCPLIISDSCMNLLCRRIEQLDFNLKQKLKKRDKDKINYVLFKNKQVEYTPTQREKILKALKDFNKWYSTSISVGAVDGLKSEVLKDYFFSVENNEDVLTNVLVDYFYGEEKSNKDILWTYFGRNIVKNILSNTKRPVEFPFRDDNGDIEYLGMRFSVKEVLI